MPNYCEADLAVKGTTGELIRFKELAREGDDLLSANKFIPYPIEFKQLDEASAEARRKAEAGEISLEDAWKVKDGFNSGGYEWCCKNWGTKWGLIDVTLKTDTPNVLLYSMSTAWSPALPVIKRMSEMFPDLHFSLVYFERGMGFQGAYECKNGEVIKDVCTDDYNGERGG